MVIVERVSGPGAGSGLLCLFLLAIDDYTYELRLMHIEEQKTIEERSSDNDFDILSTILRPNPCIRYV